MALPELSLSLSLSLALSLFLSLSLSLSFSLSLIPPPSTIHNKLTASLDACLVRWRYPAVFELS